MNRALPLLLAGLVAGSYASESRILSMGKRDVFFMDETSIFRNPANVSVYPNMIIGSYGDYSWKGGEPAHDPVNGFFGSTLTYTFKGSDASASQHPMLSLAGVFNRKDPDMAGALYARHTDTLGWDSVKGYTTRAVTPEVPKGKIDLILGWATGSGVKMGVGAYAAFQKEPYERDEEKTLESSFYRVSFGMNWPVARTMDLEASVGVGSLTLKGDGMHVSPAWDTTYSSTPIGEATHHQDTLIQLGGDTTYEATTLASNDLAINADLRLFSAMTALNGDVVPHIGMKYSEFRQSKDRNLDVAAGVGLNVNIDKGFFWAGLEALYQLRDRGDVEGVLRDEGQSNGVGGRVSFGIERNVVWDWFVVRVGGQKTLMYVNDANNNKSSWRENPETDNYDDLLGLGIGLNIENRLKFDILVSKDIPYTLTNLFSGSEHEVFSRIDATFSF